MRQAAQLLSAIRRLPRTRISISIGIPDRDGVAHEALVFAVDPVGLDVLHIAARGCGGVVVVDAAVDSLARVSCGAVNIGVEVHLRRWCCGCRSSCSVRT